MEELPDNFVGYFGTWGEPGHHLHPLSVWVTSSFWSAELDGEEIDSMLVPKGFSVFEYKGVTILGIPHSLDDKRPGSKSLFIVKGKHDAEYMVEKMKEYPEIYDIFKKLAEKY